MKNTMIILKHNLKSTMKGWFSLILIMPMVVSLIVSIINNKLNSNLEDSGNTFHVGIYTEDNSEVVDNILPKDKFRSIFIVSDKEELKENLDNGNISVGVIFNSKDIYEDIKSNKEDVIEVIYQSDYGNKDYVLSIINTGIMQINSFGEDKTEYLNLYEQYEKDKYQFNYESSKLKDILVYISSFGLFTMAFLFIAGRGIAPLLKERELKIDKRILSSKIRRVEYSLGHILGCFILLVFQSITLLGSFYLFNQNFDISLGWMIPLSFVLSFVGIAIALVVLTISSNSTMYYTLLTLIVTPMCLLSGGFVPTEFMPEMVQNFSLIFPLTWINAAYKKILMEGSYISIGLDLIGATSISLVLIMLYLALEHNRKNKLA